MIWVFKFLLFFCLKELFRFQAKESWNCWLWHQCFQNSCTKKMLNYNFLLLNLLWSTFFNFLRHFHCCPLWRVWPIIAKQCVFLLLPFCYPLQLLLLMLLFCLLYQCNYCQYIFVWTNQPTSCMSHIKISFLSSFLLKNWLDFFTVFVFFVSSPNWLVACLLKCQMKIP